MPNSSVNHFSVEYHKYEKTLLFQKLLIPQNDPDYYQEFLLYY